MTAVPARIAAAVDLDPRPDDRVLEVGGGPGVSAGLIRERLDTGRLVAVDRRRPPSTAVGRVRTTLVAAGFHGVEPVEHPDVFGVSARG